MRAFIRHPSDIPIELQIAPPNEQKVEHLCNVSLGGLSFSNRFAIQKDAVVNIRIPDVTPPFEARGRVAWCRKGSSDFEVGIELLGKEDAFRARMVEQVCHIEQYKRKVLAEEGRLLSGEDAAKEWISRFADHFPAWRSA